MFTLTGFADEISQELDEQLDVLEQLGIEYLEFRAVWGKGVLDLDDQEIARFKRELDARGIKVSAIGSPIGKIQVDAPLEPHLEKFERAMDLAELFGTPYVRMFSFFVPEGEADAYRTLVMDRLARLVEAAENRPITLLHENERRIYGDIPRRCKDILETFNTPKLRMTFDPANFVMEDVHPYTDGWAMLDKYVDYMHIKDGIISEKRIVPAGEGDGEVFEILSALKARDYDGFLSLEPHLRFAGSFKGYSGPENFEIATKALRKVIDRVEQG